MKVSVITITFNSESTIRDALRSVWIQDYPDVEHIIIDGKSNDSTLQIVNEFPHVTKVISEEDEGIYDAMNKGILMSTGDIIGILNSDDIYVDNHVISDIVTLMKSTRSTALYADLNFVEKVDLGKVVRKWKSGKFSRESFKWGWMPPHPTFFVSRKLYEAYGVYNVDLRSSADYELMLRFLYKELVDPVYLNRVIVNMRLGGESNKSWANRVRANTEDRAAWKVNGLAPYFFTTYLKPLRKMGQFFAI